MQPKVKRILLPRTKRIFFIALGILSIILVTKVFVWSMRTMRETGLSPITIFRLVFDSGTTLVSQDGRTNVLLLGMSGGSHAGADLTDTIIVLSLDTHKKTTAFISIPRDIWSDALKDKVNSAYHYGEEKKKGGGMVLAKAIMEDVVGMSIHYTLLIDFSGFEELIDLVGGIDINVLSAFTDPEFPIAGKENDACDGDKELKCRYEVLRFDAGLQHMDGERALSYVRSRHAEGEEGSDFARGRRQQDVLVALKQKLMTPKLLLNPNQSIALFDTFDRAVDTDMNAGELLTVGKGTFTTKEQAVKRISLEPLLEAPSLWLYGRYVLVPIKDFPTVYAFIQEQLKQ